MRVRAAQAVADSALTGPLKIARRASQAVTNIASHDARLAALKARGTAVRIKTSEALPNSVFDLKRSLERRGFFVHFAADSNQACEIVTSIARHHNVRSVVKSKSMATEEIGLNSKLQKAGIEVTETDLGEFIVQLANQRPAHILAPAIHKTASEISRIFIESEIIGPDEIQPENPKKEVLTAAAKRHLRSLFLEAEMGITGANFACAKEGMLVAVSNEGNLRMCVSIPRVHVALVPIEKIVDSLQDVATLLPLLARSATAQPLTSYVSFIAGPRSSNEKDGPLESHVILLDNGRTRLAGTRYESILRCIRCGACLNTCPVYTTMGGHAYGTTYMGPIGAVLATLIEENGPSQLPYASSLCGACTEVCPVSIPLHELLYELRSDPRHARHSVASRVLFLLWSRLWDKPSKFQAFQYIAASLSKLSEAHSLGQEFPGGISGATRLTLTGSRPARLLKKLLRRESIPYPVPPAFRLDTKTRSVFSLASTACTPSSSETPANWTQNRSYKPHLLASLSPKKTAEKDSKNSLVDTLISNLSRNGIKAERVPETSLGDRLEGILGRRVSIAAVDEEVLESRIGKVVQKVVQKTGVRRACGGIEDWAVADIGITFSYLAIADTGSLLLRFSPKCRRLTSLLPPVLVAIVDTDRVVSDLSEAFERLNESDIISGAALISGPSKTADIEMTLVNGVHGPATVWTLVLEPT